MASKHLQPESELRIVLVGKTGVGKTSAMNALMGTPGLTSLSASSKTTECKIWKGEFNRQKLVVIDTPGVFNTERTKDQVVKEIARCVAYAAPGPHVFLYVVKPESFTAEDENAVKIIQKIFGEESKQYTLALFTFGDENQPDEERQKKVKQAISEVHHSFNNKDKSPEQVSELLDKIKKKVQENMGNNYTNDMFKKAQEIMEREGKILDDAPPDVVRDVVSKILEQTMGKELAGLVGTAVDSVAGIVCKWFKI